MKAIKTSDIPEYETPRAAARTVKGRRAGREKKGSAFEGLSNAEKDLLLKELAVRAGLIDDSDD